MNQNRRPFSLIRAAIVLACFVTAAWLTSQVLAGDTHAWDNRVLRWFQAQPIARFNEALSWFAQLGDVPVLVGIVVIAAVALFWRKQNDAGWFLLVSTIGAEIIDVVIKNTVDRPRPGADPALFDWHAGSFPSAHAQMSLAVYLTLALVGARSVSTHAARVGLIAGALALAILLGLSRLCLGVHYPSDVLAGWAIGLGWVLCCRWALYSRVPRE
jgi:undecaprenyl-diphosphatase